VVGQVNNQTIIIVFAQDWRCVCVAFEGAFIRSVLKSYSCKWSIKKTCKWKYDYTTRLSKGGHEIKQPKVVMLRYPAMPPKKENC